ncbi:hypothetical protein C8A05DRAFT_43833 [Staphylotrichum tortipilum]|uniref:Uncharacterized protein n=1 Tax=Staphylotrichum tortipilum TaxID=2831512 RepID=A0AAN6RUQ9_9PEZI|nr:hypothetical protein C8A05DRAFT_43833 [Staphylotrichum longicolle]
MAVPATHGSRLSRHLNKRPANITVTRKRPRHLPLITWTRFYLLREQEWPVWSVDHDDIHVGPLVEVKGRQKVSLGRMAENPEQATYIIGDFLWNLPEHDNTARVPGLESSLTMEGLTPDDASSSLPPVPPSRLMTIEHVNRAVTREAQGRETFTTYLVPRAVGSVLRTWREEFEPVFGAFMPHDSEFITWHRNLWFKFSAVWFMVLKEDLPDDFCHFHLWQPAFGGTGEHEEESAAGPQARESWNQAIARVMPPAMAWYQKRWDIRPVPRFFPPQPERDPEELAHEEEQQERMEE